MGEESSVPNGTHEVHFAGEKMVYCLTEYGYGGNFFSAKVALGENNTVSVTMEIYNSPIPKTRLLVGIVCLNKYGEIIYPWHVYRDCSVEITKIDLENQSIHVKGQLNDLKMLSAAIPKQSHYKSLSFQAKSESRKVPRSSQMLEGHNSAYKAVKENSFSYTYDTNSSNSTYRAVEIDESSANAEFATGRVLMNPLAWKDLCKRILPDLLGIDEPIIMSLSHSTSTYIYVCDLNAPTTTFHTIDQSRKVCSEEDWADKKWTEAAHLRPSTTDVQLVILPNNYGGPERPEGTPSPVLWRGAKITLSKVD